MATLKQAQRHYDSLLPEEDGYLYVFTDDLCEFLEFADLSVEEWEGLKPYEKAKVFKDVHENLIDNC